MLILNNIFKQTKKWFQTCFEENNDHIFLIIIQ
jgi:hypothetical protein